MFNQMVEYVDSLSSLGGKRWMEGSLPIVSLSPIEKHAIRMLLSGHINSDKGLAKALYGASAKVDSRYRKRIGRLENRLVDVILTCTLSKSLGERRYDSIACLRNLAVGQTLLRASGSYIPRMHLLAARRAMVYPELMWYAPPVHFALAYFDAFNGWGKRARLELLRGRRAIDEAVQVHTLLELWVHISIPIRKKADKTIRITKVEESRALLTVIDRTAPSGVVAMAAARLATTLSQLEGDTKIALRWLDHARAALSSESRFDQAAEREYYTQRAFVFNTAHDYTRGIAAAQEVVKVCSANSSDWFNAMNVLLHLQLKKGSYIDATKTSELIMRQKAFNKQSANLTSRIDLRVIYARVLTNDTTISIRQVNAHRGFPLDVLVLSSLVYIRKERDADAIRSLIAIKSHVDRVKPLRNNRAVWLLSRLAYMYANAELSLPACRKNNVFNKYLKELSDHQTLKADHTVVSPLQIWRAIIAR